jgi:hypothetical protein
MNAKSNKANDRLVGLIKELVLTCNEHVKKHRSDEGSIDIVYGLAHTLGCYMNFMEAPEDVAEELHKRIDLVRESDLSKLQVVNLAKMQ